jgi:CubicO group peptidase (beta-lactamase class C family)
MSIRFSIIGSALLAACAGQAQISQLRAILNAPAQRMDYAKTAMATPPMGYGKFKYANANYIVLGAICEKLGGREWERLMEERLFRPLGITTGGFGPCPKGAPQPHKFVEGGFILPDVDDVLDNAAVTYPAGGVHMSLPDYAKWIKAVMDESGPLNFRLAPVVAKPRGRQKPNVARGCEAPRARLEDSANTNLKPPSQMWVGVGRPPTRAGR